MRAVVRLALAAAILPLGLTTCASDGTISHRRAPGALGPYSATVAADPFVFASGQIGSKRDGTLVEEIESAIDRVEEVLGECGMTLADVVSCTVYLTDIDDYAAFNEVYARRFPAPYPARACVAVAALPGRARVEIQATAARRD